MFSNLIVATSSSITTITSTAGKCIASAVLLLVSGIAVFILIQGLAERQGPGSVHNRMSFGFRFGGLIKLL